MIRSLLVFNALAPAPAAMDFAQSPAPRSTVRDPRYPAHWWTPVSREGAPSWEILPQEAGPGEVILSKRHELGLILKPDHYQEPNAPAAWSCFDILSKIRADLRH